MTRIRAGIPEWAEEGTLLLRIPPTRWPPPRAPLVLDGIAFRPKDELHVTLVGRALAAELQAAQAGDARLRAAVERLRAGFDGSLARQRQWLRLEKVEDGRTVGSLIERLELPAMAGLHRALGDLLGRALPVPPPHVTLYTAGDERGIGVPDEAALARWSVRAVAACELGAAVG